MDITWYGHSCFRITERGFSTVVTDPFDASIGYEVPKLKADIATISHEAAGHSNLDAVDVKQHVITGPGEYEIGGVLVIGVAAHNTEVEDPRPNGIYVLDYGSITVAHLGDLDHVPSQSMLDTLGQIDIALVPVGGGSSLSSGEAAEIISLLEPRIVIPMHYQTDALRGAELAPLDRFLKEMGMDGIEPESMLRISATSLPEQTQVVVLDYQH